MWRRIDGGYQRPGYTIWRRVNDDSGVTSTYTSWDVQGDAGGYSSERTLADAKAWAARDEAARLRAQTTS